MRLRPGRLALALTLVCAASVHAYFLDKTRNFDVRLRAYSQLGILTESSSFEGPKYDAGDLAQHRNFYNPEFDARLTDYLRWSRNVPGLSLVAPDDFKFRFAWWGFYDGLYDYLDPRWNRNRRDLKARFSESDEPREESFVFDDENKNPRHIYASRNRINELYLDYTKGPLFIRAGRQAISWGESDTIALLDVQNPFDLTLGAPGLFEDIDEARIPLWTLRSTVKLVDSWRFLSSVFADAYVVPGIIDTTVPIDPILGGVSPFAPDGRDPALQTAGPDGKTGTADDVVVPTAKGAARLHVAVVDRLPENTWSNSRWGARLTGVVLQDYTVQGWFFRTFNQQPSPLLVSPGAIELALANRLPPTIVDDRGFRVPVCRGIDPATGQGRTPSGRICGRALPVVTLLERRLESVVGVAATWYSRPLNGIVRTEAEYFIDELAFIPERNLNARALIPPSIASSLHVPGAPRNRIPKADYLRFVLGYDNFFFIRPLNPTNSVTLSTAFNGSINTSERDGRDFRSPLTKPGKAQSVVGPVPGAKICKNPSALPPSLQMLCVSTPPKNFEDQYKFEGFLQTAVQTDYMHGRLSPRIVIITDVSGIFAFAPTVTYRLRDDLLFSATYIAIAATRETGIGAFRDHDMVQLRVTYQLN
jgi:hypothetical protein